MVSIFGVASIMVVIVSIVVIILHNRIMKRRAPVDIMFDELEELMRQRLEMMYEISVPGSELHELCHYYIDLDFDTVLSVYADICEAYDNAEERYEVAPTAMDENWAGIRLSTETLNKAIQEYNAFITKSPSEMMMARVLGLKAAEPISMKGLSEI